jgi:hypothetical protein
MNTHAYKSGRLLRVLNEHVKLYTGTLGDASEVLLDLSEFVVEQYLTDAKFQYAGADLQNAIREFYRTEKRPTGTDAISEAINSFIDGYTELGTYE